MWELIESYAPQIIQTVAILGTVAPFLRKRIVSDKNLMLTFDDIKKTAQTVNWKEIDINKSIAKINGTVDRLNNDMINNQKMIEQTILEFAQSEFVAQMKNGLATFEEFKQTLQQKDDTIENLKIELKKISKNLATINNQLKG